MAFPFDPSQQGPFPQDANNGLHQEGAPQGIPPQQQPIQKCVQETSSPAPYAQQGGMDGSGGSVTGDAKTTLW